MPYATQGVAAQVRDRTKPAAQPAKPTLGADVIQSAMDKRPRLNANTRRMPMKPAQGGMTETPGINPAAGMPNGLPPRLQAMAAKDPAAAQVRYAQFRAGKLPGQQTDILTAAPPATGGMDPNGMPPPKEPFGGGRPPLAVGAAVEQAGPDYWTPERMAQANANPMTFNAEPMPADGGPFTAQAMDNFRANTQGMSPQDIQTQMAGSQFSANLPPQIMQRLQALQSGRGGGQGAPGAAGPGAPAGVMSATLPDYYQPPPLPRGQRLMQPTFDRRMMA